MSNAKATLLINIGQLLTLRSDISGPRRGSSLAELSMIQDAAVLCIGGKIVSVGHTKDALRDSWLRKHRKSIDEVDCRDQVILPGFVDSHTHPVFAEPRLIDFEKRIAGASYEEIAAAGGGIRSSLDGVRNASPSTLANKVLATFRGMQQHGTTAVEAKSGYGLSLESEIKSLEVIAKAAKLWPGTIVPTFLGAHSVPPEFRGRAQSYVDLICKEMIPEVAKKKLARFVDVFCEKVAFTPEQTVQIFAAAEMNGIRVRAHVGQLSETRLESILRYRPASLDHMDYVHDADLVALANSDTVATFVPGANYFLGLARYPNARKMIDSGVAVALATDFNPGSSPTVSMPMVLSLACTHLKMSPSEAITAATINGAFALGLGDRKGSVEPGKDADLAVFNVRDYREIPYWFGESHCALTVVGGIASTRNA